MNPRRDRLIAGSAVGLVLLLSAVIVTTVLDAQSRGRIALERNQAATIDQLAASMNQRLESTLKTLSGLALGPFTFKVGDSSDAGHLQVLMNLQPNARSGILLVNTKGVITNGALLRDPASIGQTLERPGLSDMFATGEAAVLPVAPGLTTGLPTIAIGYPVTGAKGAVTGGFLFESVVAIDSDFNKEISELRQGETGRFTFIDDLGTVVVSTDPSLLGQQLDASLQDGAVGLHRAGSLIVGRADLPSVGWRLIFSQEISEFEAGLGQRVQLALLLLIITAMLGGGVGFIAILRRLRAERIERERIAEINEIREEFISIVSHELRTPVAGIAGFLDSALDHWSTMDDDGRLHAVRRARANARRLQALTRDVLDTSGTEAGEFTYSFDLVDIKAEVEAAIGAIRDVEPGRVFEFLSVGEPAWVRADPDRIQQVLLNLLDNAVRNSPRDTTISIAVTNDREAALVTVRDHGAGLSDTDIKKIFEKWVRDRSTVHGTGLGLYISRRIVEAHHGKIWATNAPDGGAEFHFSVPLTNAKAESALT